MNCWPSGPEQISPPIQQDGSPSFGVARGHIDRALAGDAPCFEWLHRDALGHDIPCEVRLVRLPSSGRRLIRGSIIDITERKRSELLAAGDRRVFERITGNADLTATLEAITETAEKVTPDALCTVSVYEAETNTLHHVAGMRLPQDYLEREAAPRDRPAQRIVRRRDLPAPPGNRRGNHARRALGAPARARRRSRAAGLLVDAGPRFGRPHARHGRAVLQAAAQPPPRDFELMGRLTALAAIAIERKRSEEALRHSEAQYRSLFENVIEGVYRSTVKGRFEAVNPALAHMLGYDTVDDLLTVADMATLFTDSNERDHVISTLHRDGVVREAECQLRRRDGTQITVLINARVIRGEESAITGYEGTITDITVRKRAELQLYEEKEKAQVTLQSIGDAVITTDADGCVEYLNPVAEELTGWDSQEARGRPIAEVFHVISETTRQPVDSPITRCLREGRMVEMTEPSLLVNRRGQEISMQDSAAPIRDRAGRLIGVVMVFHDVSQERRLQRALSYQATHDALTGLINRREFEHRINETLQASRSDRGCSATSCSTSTWTSSRWSTTPAATRPATGC